MADPNFTLSPEALRQLEEAALERMEQRDFSEALLLWETRLRSGETGLAPFPLYALCLAEVGRHDEARQLCERTGKAIAGLEPGERREQLELLLRRVMVQLPGGSARPEKPLPSPEADDLFGGAPKEPKK